MLKLVHLFFAASGKPGPAATGDRKRLTALVEKRRAITAAGARILADGVASGEFRPLDAGRAVEFLEAVVEGYTHVHFWHGGAPDPVEAADELSGFVIAGLRNPDRPVKEN